MISGTLTRQAYLPTGTYGRLEVAGAQMWTVEPPWRGNRWFVSCIPEGTYMVHAHRSPRFGACWLLSGRGVFASEHEAREYERIAGSPGRWAVLIHVANWPDQVQGCIGPGYAPMVMPHPDRHGLAAIGVPRSRHALDTLRAALEGVSEWLLEIQPFSTRTHADA